MLATTRALLHGHINLHLTPDNSRLLAVRESPNGEVGVYGIAQSVAIMPMYLVGVLIARLTPANSADLVERLFADFTGAWIVALLAVVVYFVARELGAGRRSAAALALLSVFATGLWPEAKTMFSETLTALFVMTSVLCSIRAVRTLSPSSAAIAGLAVGGAALTRSTSLLFALPVALYVLVATWRAGHHRRAYRAISVSFMTGTGISIMLLLITNWWRFGSPFDNGYPPQTFDTPIATGIFGLFLSPGKSLFIYAPIALVGLLAAPIAFRARRAETLLILALFVVTIPIYATFHDWHGDNSWGPRYLYSTLPLLVVLAAPALARAAWRRAFAVAAAAGVVINVAGVLVFFNDYIGWAGQQIGPAGLARDSTGEYIYYDDMHFQPQWSPAIGEWRLLPSALKRSVLELEGRPNSVARFPSGLTYRFGWYFSQPYQLDLWWYLAVPSGIPLGVEVFAAGFLACLVAGVWQLVRADRTGTRSPAERLTAPPAAVHTPYSRDG